MVFNGSGSKWIGLARDQPRRDDEHRTTRKAKDLTLFFANPSPSSAMVTKNRDARRREIVADGEDARAAGQRHGLRIVATTMPSRSMVTVAVVELCPGHAEVLHGVYGICVPRRRLLTRGLVDREDAHAGCGVRDLRRRARSRHPHTR
jgi:hypothetical protein